MAEAANKAKAAKAAKAKAAEAKEGSAYKATKSRIGLRVDENGMTFYSKEAQEAAIRAGKPTYADFTEYRRSALEGDVPSGGEEPRRSRRTSTSTTATATTSIDKKKSGMGIRGKLTRRHDNSILASNIAQKREYNELTPNSAKTVGQAEEDLGFNATIDALAKGHKEWKPR